MSQYWMVEAALRSLLMGATIFAVLKLLRIRQVRAQRTAWVLALLAALAMPALAHWPIGPALLSSRMVSSLRTSVVTNVPSQPRTEKSLVASAPHAHRFRVLPDITAPPAGTPAATVALVHPSTVSRRSLFRVGPALLLRNAGALYLSIAALLLVRLGVGLFFALRLRGRARPAPFVLSPDDIRISVELQTPVTIGSSIVLPELSEAWDAAKLNMVLAHEREHVRQADFFVHLLAGLHCALFWFNPFSWWLQRKLSGLGEALSDLAALQQAESRASYAEVLLEFATSARQPFAAVAMARSSNLRPRIERLLNDRLFREAFVGARRHALIAAAVVPVALLGSASLVRVHAAASVQAESVQAPAAAVPAVPVAPAKPGAVVADPEPVAEPAVSAPSVVAEPERPPAAPSFDAQRQAEIDALIHPDPQQKAERDKEMAELLSKLARDLTSAQAARLRTEQVQMARDLASADAALARDGAQWDHSSYSLGDRDGDSFALVGRDGTVNFNGKYDDHFQKLREKTKGAFIYYEHDGKSYVIQDPALLAKAEALYAPMEALSKQQEELGRQQEALGRQQEALGKQQEAVKVPTPDLSKEVASLDRAVQKLKQLQASKEASQDNLAEVQGQIAEIQGRLGELQGQAGDAMGKLGEEQGRLGEQQGKLGEEQGRLGEQQGKIFEEAQRKLKPLIQQAIQDGRARPVE